MGNFGEVKNSTLGPGVKMGHFSYVGDAKIKAISAASIIAKVHRDRILTLLGIVTLVWALVVGATGMINTWADLLIKYWQHDQLTALLQRRGVSRTALKPGDVVVDGGAQRVPGGLGHRVAGALGLRRVAER